MARADVPIVEAILREAGYLPDGETRSETVRVPTTKCPAMNNGKSGGELRDFGGRARWKASDQYVTIGSVTTCFYRRADSQRDCSDFTNIPTKDHDQVRQEAIRRVIPPAPQEDSNE